MRKFSFLLLMLIVSLSLKAQTTILSEGFETPPYEFVSSEMGGVPHWVENDTYYFTGTKSIHGAVPQAGITNLTSPKFTKGEHTKVYLRFKHICKIDPTDHGLVRYIINDGTPLSLPSSPEVYFRPSSGGYSINGRFSSASYSEWNSAELTAQPTNSWWKEEIFDITSLFENDTDTMQIQFRIQKLGVGTEEAYGWLIDDIEIIGGTGEIFPPSITLMPTVQQDTVFGVGPWTVNAKITDESGVASADIFYRHTPPNGTPSAWTESPMTVINDSLFKFELPSQQYRTKTEYYIVAEDLNGNGTNSGIKWFVNKRPPAQIVIATDSTASTAMPNPFYQVYTQGRIQFIIKASELEEFGVPAGPIESIAFNVTATSAQTSAGSLFDNFNIKGGTTTQEVANTSFSQSLPVLYEAPNLIGQHAVGWNEFTFSTPIYWDGTSNLIFETCFNNYTTVSNYSGNASITQTNTSFISSSAAYTDSGTPDVCSSIGSSNLYTYSKRPVVRLGYQQTDFDIDVEMLAITQPSGNLVETSNSDVVVKIKNQGEQALTSADIRWSINDVVQPEVYNWTGEIYQDQMSADIVVVEDHFFTPGRKDIKVWVENLNSGEDMNHANDTAYKTIFVCGGPLVAGTYTIGGATPDFADIDEATSKLKICGISGPVVFNIRSGVYHETIDLSAIAGSSVANTITFKSETGNAADVAVIDTINNKATIYIDGVSNLRFENLTLKATSNTRSRVVELNKGVENVKFEGNIFEGKEINSSLANYALVYSSKTSEYKDKDLFFENNEFINGSFGLHIKATSTLLSDSIVATNNKFNNAYRSIYVERVNGLIINSNIIEQNTASTQEFSGIYITNVNRFHQINKNTIKSHKLANGIYLSSTRGLTQAFRGLISNNFIASNGNITNASGIYFSDNNNINLYYNSINITGADAVTSRAAYFSSGNAISLRNNIFANSAKGRAIYIATSPANYSSENNNLYTNGEGVGYYSSVNRVDLEAYQTASSTEANSISIDPYFNPFDNPSIIEVGLNAKGVVVAEVTDDLFGNARDVSNPDIGAVEFEVSPHDLAILEIINPTDDIVCNIEDVEISVVIRNTGTSTIDFDANNITLFAKAIGSYDQDFDFTIDEGELETGATMQVVITDALELLDKMVYEIKVWHEWALDANDLNDEVTMELDVTKIDALPYELDFSSEPVPAAKISILSGTKSWEIVEGNQASPTVAPVYGTGRLYYNAYSATSGNSSRMAMWPFDFSAVNNPIVEFWMSQDNGQSSKTKEGVTVRVSLDGGQNWLNDTLFAPRYNADFTTPGWKRFELNLANYVGYDCVTIAFDAYSEYGNNFSIDKIVVRDLFDNDIRVNYVHTLGSAPLEFASPVKVRAEVENLGAEHQFDVDVVMAVTGANTFDETIVIDSLMYGTKKVVEFEISPSVLGANLITVSVDDDEDVTNNTATYDLVSTEDYYSHADGSDAFNYQSNGNGMLLAKYNVQGRRTVKAVKAYLNNESIEGKKLYGVVMDDEGQIIGRSDTITLAAADGNTWKSLEINDWHYVSVEDNDFYVGIAQIGTGYLPIGSQQETPLRQEAFYTANATGGSLSAVNNKGRLMIGAEVGSMPAYDAQLMAITNPVGGCGVDEQEITIEIFNYGSEDILPNTLTAWYSVNEGAAVSQVVNATIEAGATYAHAFTPAFDFTPAGIDAEEFTIDVWINHPSDNLNQNDSIFDYEFTVKPTPPAPIITSDNPQYVDYMQSATLSAAIPSGFEGAINWYENETDLEPIHTGEFFETPLVEADDTYYLTFHRLDDMGYTEIGTGNSTQRYPLGNFYGYERGVALYAADEIGGAGAIESLSFYIGATVDVTHPIKIYLKTVSTTTIATNTYDSFTDGATLVYDASVAHPEEGWQEFEFTEPYAYDGSSSLMVIIETNFGGNGWGQGSAVPSIRYSNSPDRFIRWQQDNSMPIGNGTVSSNRPNIKFFKQTLGCESDKIAHDIIVQNVTLYDLQPIEVTSPVTACYLEDENVVVKIRNNFNNTVPAGAEVFCQINDGAIVSGTMEDAIEPNEIVEFTIPETYNFAANVEDLEFNLRVWTAVEGDTYNANDTVYYSFVSQKTALPLTFTDVTIPYATSHTFDYEIGSLAVYANESDEEPIEIHAGGFTTPILYEDASYWLEGSVGGSVDTVVGSGNATVTLAPYYGYYNYSWSATLYTAEEIGASGSIDTIFYTTTSGNSGYTVANQKIYMIEVDEVQFADNTPPSTTGMTLVYEGTAVHLNNEVVIVLDNPFEYSGQKSLLIYWENRNNNWTSGYPTFRASSKANVSKYAYSDTGIFSGTPAMGSNRPDLGIRGDGRGCPSDKLFVTVSIEDAPAKDVGVVEITSPVATGSYMSEAEDVSVRIKNYGTAAASNFIIGYRVGENTPNVEIYSGIINPGEIVEHTFANAANLADITEETVLKAWTKYTGDNVTINDTAYITIYPPQYCNITVTSPASHGDIGNVTLGNVYNGFPHPIYSNPEAIGGYNDYTNTVPAIYMVKGSPYIFKATTITVTASMYNTKYGVYIDYNRNANFDANEQVLTGNTTTPAGIGLSHADVTLIGAVSVPATAQTGLTRMRVVSKEGTTDAPACGSFSYGEVEDYSVYIAEPEDLDASLITFTSPNISTSIEGATATFSVRLQNTGNNPITSATVKLLHNGEVYETEWNGSLNKFQGTVVNLGAITLHGAMNYIAAVVEMEGDMVPYNDTIRMQIFASPAYNLEPIAVLNPDNTSCPNENLPVKVRVKNSGTQTLNMADNNVQIGVDIAGPVNSSFTETITEGTITAGGYKDIIFTENANFSLGGEYTVTAYVFLEADADNSNDTIVKTITMAADIAQMPITEDFTEFTVGSTSFPNGWTQTSTTVATNKYKWLPAQGQTLDGVSSGPANDHTTQNAEGKYIYAYSGYGLNGDRAYFTSQCINMNTIPGQENEISYWMHMFGAGIGRLYVEVGSGESWIRVDSLIGQQQSSQSAAWSQRVVNISQVPDGNHRVRFHAVRNSTNGNIAIDDISIAKNLPDVGISHIIKPVSYPQDSVGYNTDVEVTVTIKNFGNTIVEDVPVYYVVNNGEQVHDLFIGILNPGDEAEFTFTEPYPAPQQRTHNLCVYTNLDGDVNPDNDRSCKNVVGYPVGIENLENNGYALEQNIPNPAMEYTTIGYTVPKAGKMVFKLTDVLGKTIYTEEYNNTAGKHNIKLDVSNYAPGVYYYTLEFEETRLTKKMTIQ